MNRIKTYIITTCVLCTSVLSAQEVMQVDLQTCRKMAKENSEALKIADENIAKAEGTKTEARSAWLPNVSASATAIYNKIDLDYDLYLPTYNYDATAGRLAPNILVNPATGEMVIDADGNPVFNSYAYMPLDYTIQGGVMAGAMAEQPIYAGGKIVSANKMANIGERMANTNRALQADEVLYQTDKAYYTYLSVKAKVDLAKKYQGLLEEVEKMVKNSYEVGMVNHNELLKVQVKYNDATLQLQQAKTGLKLAQMSLCKAIGIGLNTQLEINDSINNGLNRLNQAETPLANVRKEYKLLQDQVNLAGQNVKLVRGDYLPSLGISAGYSYYSIGLKDMDNYDSHGLNVMAGLSIPITTFGERKGKMKTAKADFSIKQLELQQAIKLLQLEIEQARLMCQDAYTRVEMTETALEQANENMRISDDNYSLGMETLVDLLEAKAEWQNAYSNKIDALTDLKIKETNYLRVTNGLK